MDLYFCSNNLLRDDLGLDIEPHIIIGIEVATVCPICIAVNLGDSVL